MHAHDCRPTPRGLCRTRPAAVLPRGGLPTLRRVLPLLALAVLPLCHAADYYVAEEGNNENGGRTQAAAWQTLQHAVDSVQPGDRIVVLPGTYSGARIERSGTAEQPILLEAATNGAVVLNRPGSACRHHSILELETWQGAGQVARWTIRGFEIANSPKYGIDIRSGRHITVRDNHVHHSAATGIFTAFSDDSLIENNSSHDNGEHGVYCSNSGDRPIVRGNRLYANQACGVHMNGDLSAGGDGIISGALIERNVITENGKRGGSGINLDGVVDSLIRNNLLYDNHASGLSLFKGNGAVCSSNNRVYNNTVLVPPDGRWAVNIPDDGGINNRVVNNILLSRHTWRGSICIAAAHPPGFECHHNAVTPVFCVGSVDRSSLRDWEKLGYAAGTFAASPDVLFVDPARCDYHLRRGSPAVDAGANLQDVPCDLEGGARPQDGTHTGHARWDLGAYELQPAP